MRDTQTLKEIKLLPKNKTERKKNLELKEEVEAYLNIHRQTDEG